MLDRLPKWILLLFLKDWLSLSEVGNLDTAFCKNPERTHLLNNLTTSGLCFTNYNVQNASKYFINWILKRGISVDAVILSEKILDLLEFEAGVYFTTEQKKHLRKLIIDVDEISLHYVQLIHQLPLLVSLDLRGSNRISFPQNQLRLKNLTSLSLSGFKNISDEIMYNISMQLNKLEQFSLKDSVFVTNNGITQLFARNVNITSLTLVNNTKLDLFLLVLIKPYAIRLTTLHYCFEQTQTLTNRIDVNLNRMIVKALNDIPTLTSLTTDVMKMAAHLPEFKNIMDITLIQSRKFEQHDQCRYWKAIDSASLKHLTVKSTPNITDCNPLIYNYDSFECCPHLETIEISVLEGKLHGDLLLQIIRHVKKLQKLTLYNVQEFTEVSSHVTTTNLTVIFNYLKLGNMLKSIATLILTAIQSLVLKITTVELYQITEEGEQQFVSCGEEMFF